MSCTVDIKVLHNPKEKVEINFIQSLQRKIGLIHECGGYPYLIISLFHLLIIQQLLKKLTQSNFEHDI